MNRISQSANCCCPSSRLHSILCVFTI